MVKLRHRAKGCITLMAATSAAMILGIAGFGPAYADGDTDAAPVVTSIEDPITDPNDLALPVPESAAEAALESQRQAAANQFFETGSSSTNPMTLAPIAPSAPVSGVVADLRAHRLNLPGGGTPPASATVPVHQVTQANDTWCGPAAVLEAIKALHPDTPSTQAGLATALGTNTLSSTSGTDWSGYNVSSSPVTGYPVPDILNNRLSGDSAEYLPHGILGAAITSTLTTKFEADVVSDVAYKWPVVANIDTTSPPPHYPSGSEIQHWVTVYGYSGTGATVDIEDPASGLGGWSGVSATWSSGTPAFLNYIQGRGYVW